VPIDVEARFFRLIESPFLPPPTGLIASADDSLMNLTWDAVTNATSYNIYWASDPSVNPGNYNTLTNGGMLAGVGQPGEILNNLMAGAVYYFVVTAVDENGESAPSNPSSDIFGPQGQVHGSFFTTLVEDGNTNEIFLPGVSVTLSNSLAVVQATTDNEGNFLASHVPAGAYDFCWNAAGYGSDCSTQQVVVIDNVIILPPQELNAPASNSEAGVVYGEVTLSDGSVPVFGTDIFGNTLSAMVTLEDSSNNVVASTPVNEFGEYVLAGVPEGPDYTLTAAAEAALVSMQIDTTVTGLADLVLPVSPPVIQSVQAFLNGQAVTFAPTNAIVQIQVQASDPQGFPLNYSWDSGPGASGLVDADSPNVSLTLPAANGRVELFVEVGDGYGGYANTNFVMGAGDQFQFNGYVTDTNGDYLTDAEVNIGGIETETDTNGYFSVCLPSGVQNFVLGVSDPGYAPDFQNVTSGDAGQIWALTPLTSQCVYWSGTSPAQFTDGNGTVLQLQPNSLQSAPGSNYVGQICVNILTYDPCSYATPFPAGYEAVDGTGQTNWLTPEATALVTVSDGAGNPLQLVPGLPAMLTLPVGASCPSDTNAEETEWVWDPTNGVWRIGGPITPENGGEDFGGPIAQLGLLGVGPAAGGVTEVFVRPDRTLNYPFELRLSTQNTPVVIAGTNITLPDFKVPQNQLITIDVLSPKEAPGEYYTNPNMTNTIRLFKDKTAIMEVKMKFTQAKQDLPLSLTTPIPNLARPALVQANPTEDAHFLTYESTGQESGGRFGVANMYYSTIVPGYEVNRTQFQTWLIRNAFLPAGGQYPKDYKEDASALYFNAGDLGFARSMHMRLSVGSDGQTNIAYYVINYNNLKDALADKADGIPALGGDSIATVCMDYRADVIDDLTLRFTKFFVFQPTLFGTLTGEANLDAGGNKLTPNLCITCHGTKPIDVTTIPGRRVNSLGSPPTGLQMRPSCGDVQGHFIPFDLQAFTYSDKVGVQTAQFRALNRGIYLYTPLTAPMKELIEGWYGGALNAANNNNQNTAFVPTGWAGNAALYTSVVALSCRGCHTMRDTSSQSGLDIGFNSFNSLDGATPEGLVCDDLLMPNAQRTFTSFWGSMAANFLNNGIVPNQPALMKAALKFGATPAPPPK
jgi:hypothetical protein